MNNDQEIVQVKLDQPKNYQAATASKAFQMKLGENKTVLVYNRINNYILDALLRECQEVCVKRNCPFSIKLNLFSRKVILMYP